MATSGKKIRWNRFRYPHSPLGMIVPIDHGLTIGPVEGLKNVSEMSSWIGNPAITGVIAHKGIIERLADRGLLGGAGVMVGAIRVAFWGALAMAVTAGVGALFGTVA